MAADSNAVCAQTGITYRQLAHWVTRGYLKPTDGQRGSGVPYSFSDAEVTVARTMAALTDVGITPQAAAKAARDGYQTWLSDTVKVSVVPLRVTVTV